jgi:hypothetical protein
MTSPHARRAASSFALDSKLSVGGNGDGRVGYGDFVVDALSLMFRVFKRKASTSSSGVNGVGFRDGGYCCCSLVGE